jgi:AbiV family abortive infection protein
MAKSQEPSSSVLLNTMKACIENGERLLNDTDWLEYPNPPSSRFFLIMIAQEEFAKAFMLHLIKAGAVPFTPPVRRAINDHACKQLVGIIMDYIIMPWDDIDELKAGIEKDAELGDLLPDDVGSAIELLRYEKIRRWEGVNWFWVEDPNYDRSARRIAEGEKDRHKQDALYVRIGGDGRVCSTPWIITEDETRHELERAKEYRFFANSLLSGDRRSDRRYDKAMGWIKVLFTSKPAS